MVPFPMTVDFKVEGYDVGL